MNNVSIVIPVKNEASGLEKLLPSLQDHCSGAEIIVVNDGSSDGTVSICESYGVKVVSHSYSIGNGGAVKTGARNASREIVVFMDGDGQHRAEDVQRLVDKLDDGYDMVIGARDFGSQANFGRGIANLFYNWFSSKIVSQKIQDLTSGFRAVRRKKFLTYLFLLPNGFSYPTTITMAFFRSGWSVSYLPITADKRIGESHLRPIRDGVRFLIIIFKIATLYSPLKLFFPASMIFFFTGVSYYIYTYIELGRFTNMSALLFISAMLIFLMGLVSEQITTLLYKDID